MVHWFGFSNWLLRCNSRLRTLTERMKQRQKRFHQSGASQWIRFPKAPPFFGAETERGETGQTRVSFGFKREDHRLTQNGGYLPCQPNGRTGRSTRLRLLWIASWVLQHLCPLICQNRRSFDEWKLFWSKGSCFKKKEKSVRGSAFRGLKLRNPKMKYGGIKGASSQMILMQLRVREESTCFRLSILEN